MVVWGEHDAWGMWRAETCERVCVVHHNGFLMIPIHCESPSGYCTRCCCQISSLRLTPPDAIPRHTFSCLHTRGPRCGCSGRVLLPACLSPPHTRSLLRHAPPSCPHSLRARGVAVPGAAESDADPLLHRQGHGCAVPAGARRCPSIPSPDQSFVMPLLFFLLLPSPSYLLILPLLASEFAWPSQWESDLTKLSACICIMFFGEE